MQFLSKFAKATSHHTYHEALPIKREPDVDFDVPLRAPVGFNEVLGEFNETQSASIPLIGIESAPSNGDGHSRESKSTLHSLTIVSQMDGSISHSTRRIRPLRFRGE